MPPTGKVEVSEVSRDRLWRDSIGRETTHQKFWAIESQFVKGGPAKAAARRLGGLSTPPTDPTSAGLLIRQLLGQDVSANSEYQANRRMIAKDQRLQRRGLLIPAVTLPQKGSSPQQLSNNRPATAAEVSPSKARNRFDDEENEIAAYRKQQHPNDSSSDDEDISDMLASNNIYKNNFTLKAPKGGQSQNLSPNSPNAQLTGRTSASNAISTTPLGGGLPAISASPPKRPVPLIPDLIGRVQDGGSPAGGGPLLSATVTLARRRADLASTLVSPQRHGCRDLGLLSPHMSARVASSSGRKGFGSQPVMTSAQEAFRVRCHVELPGEHRRHVREKF